MVRFKGTPEWGASPALGPILIRPGRPVKTPPGQPLRIPHHPVPSTPGHRKSPARRRLFMLKKPGGATVPPGPASLLHRLGTSIREPHGTGISFAAAVPLQLPNLPVSVQDL